MRTQPKFHAAFLKVWNQLSSVDDWGCKYVYNFNGWAIWKAAQRYERNRLKKAGRLKP